MVGFVRAWLIFGLTVVTLNTSLARAAEILGGALVREPAVECDTVAEDLSVNGTVKAHLEVMGLLVGARWGEGVLTLNDGTQRHFNIFSFNITATSGAATDFVGEVYNLKHIDYFPGSWYGARGGLIDFAEAGEAVLNNRHCVIIKAKTSKQGPQLTVPDGGGVEINWEDD